MFTLLFYDPSLLLGGGGTDGVDGDEPMTAVLDCVSIFVSDIPRWFLAMYQKNCNVHAEVGTCHTSHHVCGNKNMYFKPKHHLLLVLTDWSLCLNLTRPSAQHLHTIKLKTELKDLSSLNIALVCWVILILATVVIYCHYSSVSSIKYNSVYIRWWNCSTDGRKKELLK